MQYDDVLLNNSISFEQDVMIQNQIFYDRGCSFNHLRACFRELL